jgi:hypothetical protein
MSLPAGSGRRCGFRDDRPPPIPGRELVASDPRWDDDVLHALGQAKGSDFEVVDTSGP